MCHGVMCPTDAEDLGIWENWEYSTPHSDNSNLDYIFLTREEEKMLMLMFLIYEVYQTDSYSLLFYYNVFFRPKSHRVQKYSVQTRSENRDLELEEVWVSKNSLQFLIRA